ncbi:guanine deaminase [candidate division TA06 bacterium]|nr:guanine deaminase [candidate division TA06 bacterium]
MNKTYKINAGILNPESPQKCRFIKDGVLIFNEDGHILYCGQRKQAPLLNSTKITAPADSFIIPGLIDCHTHLSQYYVRGRSGDTLLGWLKNHIFPAEHKFKDPKHASRVSQKFYQRLLSNGVTCAALYTNYKAGVEAAFAEGQKAGIRAVIGYTLMDRNVPDALKLEPSKVMDECRELFDKHHQKNRKLCFSLNPRFAPSCTPGFMKALGDFAKKNEVYIQTHISENLQELAEVKKLFPKARNYAEVYDRAGLLTPKTLLAHGIHLSPSERRLIEKRGCGMVHCPSSNLFLHSGRFPVEHWPSYSKLALGSDVGAGPSFSMFDVMRDAYYVNMMPLSRLFYLATLGGARALGLEKTIGSLQAGKQADFSVIRLSDIQDPGSEELLYDLIFKWDQRETLQVYVGGRKFWPLESPS